MSAIVKSVDGELFTTSQDIAEGAGVQHKNTLELIERSRSDLEEFGEVAFETRPGYNNAQVRIARLNEQQATLILTYLRNTAEVRTFKKDLVKAFYEMASALTSPRELTTAQKALEVIGELNAIVETQRQAVEAMTPKAEAYDQFMDADGTYSVGAVAKMLGLSQNKTFDRLRNEGVLIAKGAMRNTPYQQYMHHFSVKAYEFERSDGTRGTSYTTRIQPSGVDFIRRKLNIPALAVAA